uniref:PH domain-containing protein n=1 Tax=Seriola dumerili TaxID=41447 RepID=A0A3B4UPK0_SERDU
QPTTVLKELVWRVANEAWKQRWFTYEEKKNQLFYYRTPQDVTPLGRVELSCATFTYPLKAESGTFHIKTPERTFILKVKGTGRPGPSQPLRQLLLFASVSRTT